MLYQRIIMINFIMYVMNIVDVNRTAIIHYISFLNNSWLSSNSSTCSSLKISYIIMCV